MTKEELLKVINEKIEGQYNQLDLSNVVPAILRDLVGAAIGVEVEDITDIDGSVLDALSCGDKVIKVTGKQKHAYIVSYKGDGVGEGITLTYADAEGTETVSYDYTESGWAYNSTDKGQFA